ncbi:MAG TPA: hypothetical protein VN952_06970 [Chthoniobacterales bacterium]|jgi:hypothetical protein|nr:hypothetical protein [Chthoniobacterales bacterium]
MNVFPESHAKRYGKLKPWYYSRFRSSPLAELTQLEIDVSPFLIDP